MFPSGEGLADEEGSGGISNGGRSGGGGGGEATASASSADIESRAQYESASCIVGLHPDQATEPIVDFAVSRRIPFAVVPCCVFSSAAAAVRGETVSYEAFVAELRAKAEGAGTGTVGEKYLAFGGKNRVLYWIPAEADGREEAEGGGEDNGVS